MGPESRKSPDAARKRVADDLVATTLGGRYRVVAPLGRGGAGNVYVAIQEPLGREVAVKVLRADLEGMAREEFSARFLREAAVTARLRHPNLVTVHDYGTTHDGLSYVVMERLRGRTLSEHLRTGPMPPKEVAHLAIGLARGLKHAHVEGLVHRDVKPKNIVLEPGEEGLRAVLLDFGLVKATMEGDSVETQAGTYMGTPAYMAPEQARGERNLDGRADIYALGCVLYKMLTGLPPYEADNALALAVAHINEPYPPMTKRAKEAGAKGAGAEGLAVPRALEDIVRRCLEKAPEDRWRDAGELAEALERWLEEPPTRGVPVPVLAVLGGLAAAAAGGALLVGVFLGSSLNGVGEGGVGQVGADAHGPQGVAGLPVDALVEPHDPVEEGQGAGPERASSGVAEPSGEDGDPGDADPAGGARRAVSAGEAADEPRAASGVTAVAASSEKRPAPAGPSKPPTVAKPSPAPPSGSGEGKDVAARTVSAPAAPRAVTAPAPAPAAPAPVAPAPAAPVATALSGGGASGGGALVVDGVSFTADEAVRALAWVNGASEDQLRAAGVYGRGVTVILDNRPFPSLQVCGDTPQVGPKTMEAIQRGAASE